MIKISDIVRDILNESFEATLTLGQGVLNLSAYAEQIKARVEKRAKKHVKKSSIVVALSRIAKEIPNIKSYTPTPTALEVSVRSGLSEIVYERTEENLKLFHLAQKQFGGSRNEFFMTTQGMAEIAFLVSKEYADKITTVFKGVKPKAVITNVNALTTRTTEADIFTPNVFFSLLYPFAVKHFNIIEIVSTYTEITFFVDDKDVKEAFGILQCFLTCKED